MATISKDTGNEAGQKRDDMHIFSFNGTRISLQARKIKAAVQKRWQKRKYCSPFLLSSIH
jgi:hypothetical protein